MNCVIIMFAILGSLLLMSAGLGVFVFTPYFEKKREVDLLRGFLWACLSVVWSPVIFLAYKYAGSFPGALLALLVEAFAFFMIYYTGMRPYKLAKITERMQAAYGNIETANTDKNNEEEAR